MISRLRGIPLVATGVAAVAFAGTTGWVCPGGSGGGPCSHGYLSGTASLIFGSGLALVLFGLVLATGRLRGYVTGAGTILLIAGAVGILIGFPCPVSQ